MTDVAQLVTQLRMDSSEFTRKISEAKEKVAEFAKNGESSFNALGVGLTTLATGALTLLSYKIGETVNHINELYETSKKLSVSAGDLQELQYAFKDFGLSTETVTKSIQFMQRSIGEAAFDPQGQFAKAFSRINLDAKELLNLKPEEQLLKITNEIKNLNNASLEQAELRKFFGRGGGQLAGAVQSGELQEAIKKYEGLGISDKTAEDAHKFVLSLNYAGAELESKSFKIMGAISSWLNNITTTIHTVARELKSSFDFIEKYLPQGGVVAGIGRGTASATGLGTWNDNRSLLEVFLEKYAPKSLSDQGVGGKIAGDALKTNPSLFLIDQIFGKSSEVSNKANDSIKRMGDSANEASYNIKELSRISDMLKSAEKKSTDDALKDLLGKSLTGDKPALNLKNLSKPFESFEKWTKNQQDMGLTNNTNAAYIQAKAAHDLYQDSNLDDYKSFQSRFQQVFKDAKNYGLNGHPITGGTGGNMTVKDEINDLRQSAKGLGGEDFDTSGIVGAINDLQNFAKEQKSKDNKVEMTVKLDKGLLADAKSGEGVKITIVNDAINSAFATAASSMGK